MVIWGPVMVNPPLYGDLHKHTNTNTNTNTLTHTPTLYTHSLHVMTKCHIFTKRLPRNVGKNNALGKCAQIFEKPKGLRSRDSSNYLTCAPIAAI